MQGQEVKFCQLYITWFIDKSAGIVEKLRIVYISMWSEWWCPPKIYILKCSPNDTLLRGFST
jgi:hypothetical protein